jgi:hypothetical protein
MKAALVILFALVAFVAANGGKGGFKLPQSCKDGGAGIKKCYEDYLHGKNVNIQVEDVMKCFKRYSLYTYC